MRINITDFLKDDSKSRIEYFTSKEDDLDFYFDDNINDVITSKKHVIIIYKNKIDNDKFTITFKTINIKDDKNKASELLADESFLCIYDKEKQVTIGLDYSLISSDLENIYEEDFTKIMSKIIEKKLSIYAKENISERELQDYINNNLYGIDCLGINKIINNYVNDIKPSMDYNFTFVKDELSFEEALNCYLDSKYIDNIVNEYISDKKNYILGRVAVNRVINKELENAYKNNEFKYNKEIYDALDKYRSNNLYKHCYVRIKIEDKYFEEEVHRAGIYNAASHDEFIKCSVFRNNKARKALSELHNKGIDIDFSAIEKISTEKGIIYLKDNK